MERTTPQNLDSINLATNCLEPKEQECLQQVNHLSEPSEATNPFTSREFAAIHQQVNGIYREEEIASDGHHSLDNDLAQQGEPGEHNLPKSGKATQTSHPSNDNNSADKSNSHPDQCARGTKRATLRVNAESSKEVRVQPLGMSTGAPYIIKKEFALTQSQHNYGFKMHVVSSNHNQRFPRISMELNFDPGSDAIVLCKIAGLSVGETINVQQLPVSPRSITSQLEFMEEFSLNVSSYSICLLNEHLFDITVFPRRYFSFVTKLRSQPEETKKRALELSSSQQDSAANKRAKVKEASQESPVSAAANHSAPIHPPTDELVAADSLSVASNSDSSVNSGLCHPLAELQLGETVKLVGATKEEDYELTRKADISVQPNSLVCKASSSKIRELVVKVWRSKLDYDASGVDVSSAGKYWLNEVKAHSEIGRHHAIATFLGADARLLSIYMECIHAPSLQSYCESHRNAYCKLGYFDARRILYNIADALNFIHGQGFSHDDIKPANILYSNARGPVLIDFGWSSRSLPQQVGYNAGSPWYIPPEYIRTGMRGHPGDVFALGVVMLFLLRQIPLPESQSPLLNWRISHLRGGGSDADRAMAKMERWLELVKRATCKLRQSPGPISDKYVRDIVVMIEGMLKASRRERITSGALFEGLRKLKNPDAGNINLTEQN